MEKFRHFGDAATGINPFTFVIAPTTLGLIGATCMFPMRLLFSSIFILLLLLTDTLLYVFYVTYLTLVGRVLLAPLQRLWLRGLLFFIGHILPMQQGSVAVAATKTTNNNNASEPAGVPHGAGDIIFCNLQSVWDVCVLEVVLGQPYHTLVFPDAERAGGLCVMPPNPLQRWQAWSHIRRTGTIHFLDAALAAASKKSTGEASMALVAVQKASRVPLWFFAEGTCSNGRGILTMPAVVCRANHKAPSCCTVGIATIQYDSPALQNVVGADVESPMRALFRTALLLYGTNSPAWSSPFFPSAEVQARSVRVQQAKKESEEPVLWRLSEGAMTELRQAMSQRGQALVVKGSGAAGGVRRQPLSVGIKEKKGFVEAYKASGAAKK